MKPYFNTSNYYDSILFESSNFFAVPSVGSLVAGWMLIVPRECTLNFSELAEDKFNELEEFIFSVKNSLKNFYGEQYILFEHGPNKIGSKTGCSVDYAHLHLLPTQHDLLKESSRQGELDWDSLGSIKQLPNKVNPTLDYLMYIDQSGNISLSQKEEFPSQYFRKILASLEGIEHQYNWRLFPFEENIKNTIKSLQKVV